MNFPPLHDAPNYDYFSPWTDSKGRKWVYDGIRWSPFPGSVISSPGGGVVISQAVPPVPFEGMKWFRTIDGATYTFYQGFWVSGASAPVPALEDVWAALDTKLSTVTEPITLGSGVTAQNMLSSHANAYVRFTAAGAKTYTVILADNMLIGSTVTLRNASPSGDITITPESVDVTVTGEVPSFVIPPKGTGQLIKVAAATWDLV